MERELQHLLECVASELLPLGFVAQGASGLAPWAFAKGSQLRILLEHVDESGQRFDLVIERANDVTGIERYAVHILMLIFEDYRAPLLENQLDFILAKQSQLFAPGVPPFKSDYEFQNDLIWTDEALELPVLNEAPLPGHWPYTDWPFYLAP